jgi:hypothetical protein
VAAVAAARQSTSSPPEHGPHDGGSVGPGGVRAAGWAALRALIGYILLTVALTWPMAQRLHVMDPGDSAFFAWVMAWELHALRSAPASLPHANAYHPERYVLGLDEPVLGTTLLALPLALFSDDAIWIFNVVRLLTFVFSALGAYLLARELGCRAPAAWLAGALFAFAPIRTDQLAHLSTLGTQWLPLVFLFLVRVARRGRLRDGLAAGFAGALAFYACGYHGLLGVLVWPPAVLCLMWGRRRAWRALLLAVSVAGLLVLPLYLLHRAAFAPHAFTRGAAETTYYSAGLQSFLATSALNRLYGTSSGRFRGAANGLFPGLVPVSLVLAAALAARRARRWPSRPAWALACLAAGGALVALGPELRWGETVLAPGPVAAARALLPVFAQVRAYSRAGIYLALGLALLAALAFERLRLGRVAGTLVALLALAETLIVPVPLARWARVIDSTQPAPPVYRWLAQQPPVAIVELPLLTGDSLFERPAYHESIYMVRSTLHWQRLVNGHIGMEPQRYARLRALLRQFPSRASLDELRAAGVRYAIVHARGFGPNQWRRFHERLPDFAAELPLAARFDDDWVFDLGVPSTPGP